MCVCVCVCRLACDRFFEVHVQVGMCVCGVFQHQGGGRGRVGGGEQWLHLLHSLPSLHNLPVVGE